MPSISHLITSSWKTFQLNQALPCLLLQSGTDIRPQELHLQKKRVSQLRIGNSDWPLFARKFASLYFEFLIRALVNSLRAEFTIFIKQKLFRKQLVMRALRNFLFRFNWGVEKDFLKLQNFPISRNCNLKTRFT